MTLTEQINQDVKTAMKQQDKDKLKVIRMLKAALQKEQLEHKEPLTEEQEITVISRELKQRKDALVEFKKANRDDLVISLEQEIDIVTAYLPKQLERHEILDEIKQIATEVSATAMSDFGKVMGKAMAKLKGKADGQLVNELVKEYLSEYLN